MLHSVKALVLNLHEEKERLAKENEELKKKLQFRHTEINDLRYSKRELLKMLQR